MSAKPDWIVTERGCNTEHWVQVSEIVAIDVGPYQRILRMRGGSLEQINGRARMAAVSRLLGVPLYREEEMPPVVGCVETPI